MDDTWAWVYLGVQALQTVQTIALRRDVQRTVTSLRPPPPDTLQLPMMQPRPPPLWRSFMPSRGPSRAPEQDQPRDRLDTPNERKGRS